MRFDPDQPHAVVYGFPGVSWQQGGAYFRRDGMPVADPEAALGAAEPVAMVASERDDPNTRPDDLRLAENKRLKAMLDVYGEPWTTARNARLFLEGKQ